MRWQCANNWINNLLKKNGQKKWFCCTCFIGTQCTKDKAGVCYFGAGRMVVKPVSLISPKQKSSK